MAREENRLFGEESNDITIRERLSMYLANWPLFLLCIFVCVSIGIFYARYTVPKFMATTSFLIKEKSTAATNANDIIESSLSGKMEVNLNNEILLVSSSNLMERTVAKNGFNISYYNIGRLLTLNIYKDAPFVLIPKQITDSNRTVNIYIKEIDGNGGLVSNSSSKDSRWVPFKWNATFKVENQSFLLEPKGQIQSDGEKYIAKWEPVSVAADALTRELMVKSYDTKTSVINLAIKTDNYGLGKDVLNALFSEFNLTDIEDRNKLSELTVQFIDERLMNISGELKGVEGNLEKYQGNNELVNVSGQSTQSLANENDVSKTIKDLSIQQGVVSMVLNYFSNPANKNRLVPSTLGLNDPTLASLIAQYNELQLKKEREAPLVAPNSTVMQDLETQLTSLKGSILESLNNISKNFQLQENNYRERNTKYRSFLSSLPHNERVLQEIKRKQTITEGLYLYLLQKREEAAISSTASNVAHYKQIDKATGYGPVEPNTKNLILYSFILGFVIAFGWIYIRSTLNDKVLSRDDIAKRVSSNLLGEINNIPKSKKQAISVLDRDIAGEQFRSIRTNLAFLLKDSKSKVILISSCTSGEGKSFVSLNLASVLAMPGKKVALLEFDIRKPVIMKELKLDYDKGLTDYLAGNIDDLSDCLQVIEEIPTLHIYPSGEVPANPGDLLLTERVQQLFETLKKDYDYVVVDSAPIRPVSDAFILGEFSDVILFVVRQNVTLKKQLDFINDVIKNKKFRRSGIILNDLKAGKKYGYYDYRYDEYEQEIKKKKPKLTV